MNFFGFVVIRLWGSYFYICVYLIQHSTFMHPREQSIHILEKCCSSLALRHIYTYTVFIPNAVTEICCDIFYPHYTLENLLCCCQLFLVPILRNSF